MKDLFTAKLEEKFEKRFKKLEHEMELMLQAHEATVEVLKRMNEQIKELYSGSYDNK